MRPNPGNLALMRAYFELRAISSSVERLVIGSTRRISRLDV